MLTCLPLLPRVRNNPGADGGSRPEHRPYGGSYGGGNHRQHGTSRALAPQKLTSWFVIVKSADSHRKVDARATRIWLHSFRLTGMISGSVAGRGLSDDAAHTLYNEAARSRRFKRPRQKVGTLTNPVFGASILALRGRSLDTGLKP